MGGWYEFWKLGDVPWWPSSPSSECSCQPTLLTQVSICVLQKATLNDQNFVVTGLSPTKKGMCIVALCRTAKA